MFDFDQCLYCNSFLFSLMGSKIPLLFSVCQVLPKSCPLIVQSQSSASMVPEHNHKDSSSGPGDLTDSVAVGEASNTRRIKKSKVWYY